MPRAAASPQRPPPAPSPPPHLPRLLARLRALDAPLVQLWTWPGSGEQALLEALLAAEGDAARAVAVADLADERRVARLIARVAGAGVRWLVLPPLADPAAVADAAARIAPVLVGGLRLVFAAPERLAPAPLAPAFVTAADFALTEAEVGTLWQAVAGRAAGVRRVRALRRATGGWYRPLALAAEAAAAGAEVDPTSVAALPAVAGFLRHEVLAQLGAEGARRLGEGGFGGGPPPPLLTGFLAGPDVEEGGPPALGSGTGGRAATGADPLAFDVSLLGPGAVVRHRGDRPPEPIRWSLKRAFKVLAFLAAAPEMKAGSDELREAVWYDEGEDKVRRNFHPTLSHLRRALGAVPGGRARRREGPPPLVYAQGVYRLNPELGWSVDAVEFEAGCDEGRRRLRSGDAQGAATSWEGAWRRFGGPLLQGADDPWIVARRPHYQRLYLEMLTGLGDLYARRGRLGEAMDALRTALIEDPLQEQVAVQLMQVYARQGRRDLVRRQYDRLTATLRAELGLEPLAETSDEYHRLMG